MTLIQVWLKSKAMTSHSLTLLYYFRQGKKTHFWDFKHLSVLGVGFLKENKRLKEETKREATQQGSDFDPRM